MGLNHSQTTLFSQKQGWKCVCDGLKLKTQTEEKEEKELSPRVRPGWTCATRMDRGRGLSDTQTYKFSSPQPYKEKQQAYIALSSV